MDSPLKIKEDYPFPSSYGMAVYHYLKIDAPQRRKSLKKSFRGSSCLSWATVGGPRFTFVAIFVFGITLQLLSNYLALGEIFSDSIVNVRKYGAKGNGTDDDSSSIQAAINRAARGSTIFFPKGTYVIRSTLMVSKDHLMFEGEANKTGLQSIIQRAKEMTVSPMFEATKRSFITVQYLIFDGNQTKNKTALKSMLSFISCTDIVFTGNEVRNAPGAKPYAAAIAIENSMEKQKLLPPMRTTITYNYFHDIGGHAGPSDAIFTSGNDVFVANNLIERATDTGIVWEAGSTNPRNPTTKALIQYNAIKSTGQGIAADAAKSDSSGTPNTYLQRAQIIGNVVESSRASNQAGISVYTMVGGAFINVFDIIVAGNTIQHATAGNGIFINGTGNVAVQNNKILDISPKNGMAGIVILHSKNTSILENEIRGAGGTGVSIQASKDVLVENNRITNNSLSKLAGYPGIFIGMDRAEIPCNSVIVRGNQSSGAWQSVGLLLGRYKDDPTTDVRVEHNDFHDNKKQDYLNQASGSITLTDPP